MFSIWFGKDYNASKNPDGWFDNNYEWEWFDDPFTKKILEEVEGTTYDEEYNFKNPFRRSFGPRDIGGGIKTVLLMKFFKKEGLYFNLVCCGEDLAPYIAELSLDDSYDIKCTLSGPYMSFKDLNIKMMCENNRQMMYTNNDFIRNKLDYLNSERNVRTIVNRFGIFNP